MEKSISRADLIKKMKFFGFSGPFSGGRHQFMAKDNLKVRIPNPHSKDISRGLLVEIIKQADIAKEDWDRI